MAKTVSGLFDNQVGAHNVVQELLAAGFRHEDISIMSKEPERKNVVVEYVEEDGHQQVKDMAKGAGTGAAIGGAAGLLLGLAALTIPGIGPVLAAGPLATFIAGTGIGATAGGLISGLTRLGVPESEANAYAEAVRRGATLISVNVADERADHVIALMKRHGAVEIDKRTAQWREEGWTGFDNDAATRLSNAAGFDNSDVTAEHERIATQAMDANQGDIALPVIEEKLEVNKREVERGGVRLQTRVTEKPVEENVQLREEHVKVERRPVDYTFHGTESEAFQENIVEIKEAYEELIVKKKARVVEEVVVGKEIDQHTETVHETLRRTDVDIEQLEGGGNVDRAKASAQGGGASGGGPNNK